jgi:hypothetical protein
MTHRESSVRKGGVPVADLPRYHLGEQYAPALLRPISSTLRDLEARARHYRTRLHLNSATDQAALDAAEQALAAARATLERLVRPGA